jgi:hypothetical protein
MSEGVQARLIAAHALYVSAGQTASAPAGAPSDQEVIDQVVVTWSEARRCLPGLSPGRVAVMRPSSRLRLGLETGRVEAQVRRGRRQRRT